MTPEDLRSYFSQLVFFCDFFFVALLVPMFVPCLSILVSFSLYFLINLYCQVRENTRKKGKNTKNSLISLSLTSLAIVIKQGRCILL